MKRCDVLDVVDELEAYMKQNHRGLVDAARSRKFSANMNILMLMSKAGVEDESITARCWGNVKQLRVLMLLNPYVRLKNKIGALMSYMGLNLMQRVFKKYRVR